jgi:hypothetical protein
MAKQQIAKQCDKDSSLASMRRFAAADKSKAPRAARGYCARPSALIVRATIAGGVL